MLSLGPRQYIYLFTNSSGKGQVRLEPESKENLLALLNAEVRRFHELLEYAAARRLTSVPGARCCRWTSACNEVLEYFSPGRGSEPDPNLRDIVLRDVHILHVDQKNFKRLVYGQNARDTENIFCRNMARKKRSGLEFSENGTVFSSVLLLGFTFYGIANPPF